VRVSPAGISAGVFGLNGGWNMDCGRASVALPLRVKFKAEIFITLKHFAGRY
jgi:hypothetical protein